jgi:small ligand-binding sensory domain FIST
MKFQSRLSLRRETEDAVHDLCVDLKSFAPDLAMVFASHHFGPEFDDLVGGIYQQINCRNLIGCTGESIVGPTAEIENQPAIALWVAKLPGVRVLPFVVDQEDVAGFGQDAAAWRERLGTLDQDPASIIILPDPFTVDVQACIDALDTTYPQATTVGGMASGATGPGQNRLFLNDQTIRRGMVGVSLTGDIAVSAVVSQGCRPVGNPYVITKAEENFIQELGGRPAYAVLQELYKSSEASIQALMRKGLHVGRLIDEHRRDLNVGGFLVRNMMGVREDQAIAVGDYLRPGQTVQFQVRDSQTADEELERLLQVESERPGEQIGGALLFTCNGRGKHFSSGRITISDWSTASSENAPRRDSSPRARSGRSAERPSSTAIPAVSYCSANPPARRPAIGNSRRLRNAGAEQNGRWQTVAATRFRVGRSRVGPTF